MNGRTNSNGVGTDTLQVPLDPPVNLTATAGNAEVSLTWEDPVDKYATPEGETAQDPQQLVSEWDYTVVVRKVGSQPNDPNDGTVVTKSSIRNQYQISPYEDTGLINDTVYFYGVFAVNKDGVASNGVYDNSQPTATFPISELALGSLINIRENGAYAEYQVIHQGAITATGYSNANGTWVIRKDILCLMIYQSDDSLEHSYTAASYAISDIKKYLETEYINIFDNGTKENIKQIKIGYRSAWDRAFESLSCRAFILSTEEFGEDQAEPNTPHASCLDYFNLGGQDKANSRRIAKYNGSPYRYWTRTPSNLQARDGADVVNTVGDPSYNYGTIFTDEYGVRPAFILNSTSQIDQNMNLVPN